MGRWTDIAQWSGPAADNFGDGDAIEREPSDRMSGHRGLVLHIAEGTYPGTIAWERNPDSDISSHWVLARDGRCVQLVDTDDRPWTQGAGNTEWLSVECEGRAGDLLTPVMVEVLAQLLARAHLEYGVPLQLADSPGGRGLGWHGMGGAAWGGHTGCPGAPIVAQRPEIIARAEEIVGGVTAATGMTEDTMQLLRGPDGTIVLTDWRVTLTPPMADVTALRAGGVMYAEVSAGTVATALTLPRPGAVQPAAVTLSDAQAALVGDRIGAALAGRAGLTRAEVAGAVRDALRIAP
jgi:hypothetical protein